MDRAQPLERRLVRDPYTDRIGHNETARVEHVEQSVARGFERSLLAPFLDAAVLPELDEVLDDYRLHAHLLHRANHGIVTAAKQRCNRGHVSLCPTRVGLRELQRDALAQLLVAE